MVHSRNKSIVENMKENGRMNNIIFKLSGWMGRWAGKKTILCTANHNRSTLSTLATGINQSC